MNSRATLANGDRNKIICTEIEWIRISKIKASKEKMVKERMRDNKRTKTKQIQISSVWYENSDFNYEDAVESIYIYSNWTQHRIVWFQMAPRADG